MKGGVRITKERIIIASSLVLLALLIAFGAIGMSLFFADKAELDNERLLLASVQPKQSDVPNIDGFALDILCDTDAKPVILGDEGSPDDMLRGISMRNAHIESESGARINVTLRDDFYNTAKNDILSGKYEYDLYAANVLDGLSRLLSDGSLHDISDSEYIDLEADYYDGNTTNSLSVGGGKYLISSDIADARWWSEALLLDGLFEHKDSVKALAESGELTLSETLVFGDVTYDHIGAYALYFGVGGRFASMSGDAVSIVSLSDFSDNIEKIAKLSSNRKDTADIFSLGTLYEARGNDEKCILPLPKAMAENEYGGYIDLSQAVLVAIPAGARDLEKTEYLFDRMAELSAEYVAPYFKGSFDADKNLYDIITDSSACDLSVLFGYGDIGSLVKECMQNDTRLTLEYYSRKALYEKALSIVVKRLCIEE